jgi:predicted transcriptional regulator
MEKIPCEYIVWNVLPTIRKEFAKSMIRNYNFNQNKIAEILELTPSAVSQYLSNKRGVVDIIDDQIQVEIDKSVRNIVKKRTTNFSTETCRICTILKNKKLAIKKTAYCKGCDKICETAVWEILPVIRKEFSKNLIKYHKFNQKKVSEVLGISEAAVSRYLSRKRGNIKISDRKIIEEIQKSTNRIAKGNNKTAFEETCRICTILKSSESKIGLKK